MKFLSDQPSSDDAFNRLVFANGLSRAICLPKNAPGLVIGIEGEWGSGKSTVINFIKGELQKNESHPIVLDFNPWMVSGSTAIVEILISQIASAVGSSPLPNQAANGLNAGRKLLDYVRLLRHLKYLKYVPGLASAGHVVEGISDVADNLDKPINDVIEGTKTGIEEVENLLPKLDLQAQKNHVIEALNALDSPIVIVIDDLDRLLPDEIRAMMQALKAVADFPRVTYVLAYDAAVVGQALGIGQSEAMGRAYLEKIVQVSYPLPPVFPWQLRNFAFKGINDLLVRYDIPVESFEHDRFNNAISLVTKLSKQPRDVIRLVNRLTLSLPAIHGEVDLSDVIVFEALTQKVPEIRQAITRYPEDFVGEKFSDTTVETETDWGQFLGRREDNSEPRWKTHLSAVHKEDREIAKACRFLFPHIDGTDSSQPAARLPISSPDRLIRFLSLTSTNGIPDIASLNKLLQTPSELESMYEIDPSNYVIAMKWITQYIDSLKAERNEEVIDALIRISWQQIYGRDISGGLPVPYSELLLALLRKSDKAKWFELIIKIIDTAPLSLSEPFVLNQAMKHGKWSIDPTRHVPEKWSLIDDETITDKLISHWCVKVEEKANDGNTLSLEPRLHSVLFRWLQLGNNALTVLSAVKRICSTADGLERFLRPYADRGMPWEVTMFDLVWDADELSKLIEQTDGLQTRFPEYFGRLRSTAVREHIALRNKKLFDDNGI